jgi:hypothetical protein
MTHKSRCVSCTLRVTYLEPETGDEAIWYSGYLTALIYLRFSMKWFPGFSELAQHFSDPLVLTGFTLCLLFGTFQVLLRAGLLSRANRRESAGILRLVIHYGFIISVLVALAGFGLAYLRALRFSSTKETPTASQEAQSSEASFNVKWGQVPGREPEIVLFNPNSPVTNTEVECYAVVSLSAENVPPNKGVPWEDGYTVPCGEPPIEEHDYDPNRLWPFWGIKQMMDVFPDLKRTFSPKKVEIHGNVSAILHVSYDDRSGIRRHQYLEVIAWMLRLSISSRSIGPAQFARDKQQRLQLYPQKEAGWPCRFYQVSNTDCVSRLLKGVHGGIR